MTVDTECIYRNRNEYDLYCNKCDNGVDIPTGTLLSIEVTDFDEDDGCEYTISYLVGDCIHNFAGCGEYVFDDLDLEEFR